MPEPSAHVLTQLDSEGYPTQQADSCIQSLLGTLVLV